MARLRRPSPDTNADVVVNRPGMSGGSVPWEGWSVRGPVAKSGIGSEPERQCRPSTRVVVRRRRAATARVWPRPQRALVLWGLFNFERAPRWFSLTHVVVIVRSATV